MTDDRYGAARFAADTAKHKMTVLHDDGLYRHLRFQAPGTGFYWFDLVTWPGRLAFTGDMDGYVFARTTDMFEFFRTGSITADNPNRINPGYWAEKTDGGRRSCKEYSDKRFKQLVDEYIAEHAEEFPGLAAAVETELEDVDWQHEDSAREFLRDFEYVEETEPNVVRTRADYNAVRLNRNAPVSEVADAVRACEEARRNATFRFHDTWEWELSDYTWSFLWACNAIAWGIRAYDAVKAGEPIERPAPAESGDEAKPAVPAVVTVQPVGGVL